jgi:hypothetical protein
MNALLISRRHASVAGLCAAVMPSAAKHDDAALLALHAEYDQLERSHVALIETNVEMSPDSWSECESDIVNAMLNTRDRLTAMRATTLAGLQARARSIVAEDIEVDDPDSLTAALLRDLLALGAGSAVT